MITAANQTKEETVEDGEVCQFSVFVDNGTSLDGSEQA